MKPLPPTPLPKLQLSVKAHLTEIHVQDCHWPRLGAGSVLRATIVKILAKGSWAQANVWLTSHYRIKTRMLYAVLSKPPTCSNPTLLPFYPELQPQTAAVDGVEVFRVILTVTF